MKTSLIYRLAKKISLVRYLPISERKGKVFAVGDLHGEFNVLMKALHAVEFDFNRDRLLFVGDIHDRGRNSQKCIELLHEPWADSVLGNHELMMLESIDSDGSLISGGSVEMWLANGGEWALEAPKEKRTSWSRLMMDTVPLHWVVERRDGRKVLVCHAEPDPVFLADVRALKNRPVPVRDLRGSPSIWGRRILGIATDDNVSLDRKLRELRPVDGFLYSVHGHTRLKMAGWVNNQLFADTGAVFGDLLTLVDLDHAIPGRPNRIYAWSIASEKLVGYAATNLLRGGH